MKISFSLPFFTNAAESPLIAGSIPELGSDEAAFGLNMHNSGGGRWTGQIELPQGYNKPFYYRYALHDHAKGTYQYEGGNKRYFDPAACSESSVVELRDFWQPPADPDAVFKTAPFRQAIFRSAEISCVPINYGAKGIHIRLKISAPRISPDLKLYCVGDIPALGLWNPQKAVPMQSCSFGVWYVDFHTRRVEIPFQYKYLIVATHNNSIIWESGENRRFTDDYSSIPEDNRVIVVSDFPLQAPLAPWKGAGLAIPVFSLRTLTGMGVGEFPDLKLLVDWAKQMGMQMIQILPVNDTSVNLDWRDDYPYAISSVFALHPLYLNLQAIGGISSSMISEISAAAAQLNKNDVVDYEAVMSAKMGFLKRIFSKKAQEFLASDDFQTFFREHCDWLKPYAAFCCLRDIHGTGEYHKWSGSDTTAAQTVDSFWAPGNPHTHDAAFYCFVQYHLHRQLMEAADYARKCGVVLKGDIPIGVAKQSLETWLHPQLFAMDTSAGAPPDDFAVNGQNWGFPTYNWETMAAEGYAWWKKRLAHLSRYFDAVRLDHIIGFFRIWEIPGNAVTALTGRFNPAIPMSREELEAAGISDIETLCQPDINVSILQQIFGAKAELIIDEYLEPAGAGRYRFRAAFDTQRKVADHIFTQNPDSPLCNHDRDTLLQGLFRLHDNMILIPDKSGDRHFFHPRIAMESTFAFKSLDSATQSALTGICRHYFYQRHETLWAEGARRKLAALNSAGEMLICGEDLGMVPQCTAGIMEDLGILGLRIQRMPADPSMLFADPAAYPYLCVASPSSHDMTTIRGWWEESDRAVIQHFFSQILRHPGIAPKKCETWICREIINMHLESSSMWAVFPIQDILGINADLRRPNPCQERINEPADASNRWNFRLHLSIEMLVSQQHFNAEVRSLVLAAHR